MSLQPAIFLIVVTYNGMRWLPKHVNSIKISSLALKAIYVDNGSTDGTIDFIETHFSEATLIKAKENLGFGKANNIGAKHAIDNGAEYIFLLNQDAYLTNDTVKNCLRGFNLVQKAALVSPVHLDGTGNQLDIGFQRCITDELCPGFVSDLALGRKKEIYPIYSANAAAWMLKVSSIKKLGLFSPVFFHYGEDINFQQRLKYFGYTALLIPDALIMHDRQSRNGKKSELGRQIEVKTNQMTILMNINEPYLKTVKSVWKYAGLLVFEGKIWKSILLIVDTYWNCRKYLEWREQMRGKIEF